MTRGSSQYKYIKNLHKSILTLLSISSLSKSNDSFVWETDQYLTYYLIEFSLRTAAPKYHYYCTFKHVTLNQETHENQRSLTSLTSNLVQMAYLKMQHKGYKNEAEHLIISKGGVDLGLILCYPLSHIPMRTAGVTTLHWAEIHPRYPDKRHLSPPRVIHTGSLPFRRAYAGSYSSLG